MLVTSHAVEYALWLASWGFVGVAAFEGRFDRGWFIAWALLLLTLIPLHAISAWLKGVIAISAGGLLKQRLLAGALRLAPEELRRQGAGQLLGRVMESEALESLACNGGFAALIPVVELVMAAAVLAGGAGGTTHVLILLLWSAITLSFAWRYFRLKQGWTARRLAMTHDLVEHMVGHRTRLAQETPERWHEEEDQALERYLAASQHMDRAATWLSAFVPIGWLMASILTLAQPFISGSASPAGLALGIGGTLLAYQAFKSVTTGLWNLSGAAIAWREVNLLFHAAARPQPRGTPDLALRPQRQVKETLLDVQDVVFRYQNRPEPILRGCNLRIAAGDRMVLEGPSGGGKSTLGSLLAGWRTPSSGLVLAGGLDQGSLGFENWRRAVVCAPQFHENHVLCGPFALNLLMSRGGLFSDRDLEEARTICQELGLGELLARMPGGMMQMVGESGWQLSHGERSRLYIARALLQRAEVIVLDESFAALDPENLRLTLDCIHRHAPAALVIAHR
jgi:ATP-binding cassette subfamily B protein